MPLVTDAGCTKIRCAGPGTEIASAWSMRPARSSLGWMTPANSGRPEPRAPTAAEASRIAGALKPGPLSGQRLMNW